MNNPPDGSGQEFCMAFDATIKEYLKEIDESKLLSWKRKKISHAGSRITRTPKPANI